ncbi:MAG: hypothetical protein AB7Q29_12155 [Vicinamibacterales bacterium]
MSPPTLRISDVLLLVAVILGAPLAMVLIGLPIAALIGFVAHLAGW